MDISNSEFEIMDKEFVNGEEDNSEEQQTVHKMTMNQHSVKALARTM